jgi:hypothetical protein
MLTRRIVWLLIFPLWWACTPDEEVFSELSDESLYFSTDTLYFDTLLTTQLSPSYRLLLYNPNKNGVIVPGIRLKQLEGSPFELTINGLSGKEFNNIKILGKDSLLVLVNGRLPVTGEVEAKRVLDYLEVIGTTRTNVVLDAWAQDASYYKGLSVIEEDETWHAGMPYVVSDSLAVAPGVTLTIKAGVEVLMQPGAQLFVLGTLITEGTPGKKVVFRNTRNDRDYREAPGQWVGIYFLEGSKDNFLSHTVIKNGEIGLRIGTPDDDDVPDVVIANCTIGNMSSDGILALVSDVYAYNTVVYNAARYLVANVAGGNYRYEHCTFSNYPSDFFREDPSVIFSDNILLANEELLTSPLQARVFNSVIWGTQKEEIEFNTEGGASFIYQVGNSLLKTTNSLLNANNNLINTPPKFFNEFLYDYRPDSLSPLINRAKYLDIDLDNLGHQRDSLPDIGAYEWVPGQKEDEEG